MSYAPEDLPSHLAIYPKWFPFMADAFGHELERVAVTDNVVCGGAQKIVYKADWSLLHSGDLPASYQDFSSSTILISRNFRAKNFTASPQVLRCLGRFRSASNEEDRSELWRK